MGGRPMKGAVPVLTEGRAAWMHVDITPAEAPEIDAIDYTEPGDPARGRGYVLTWPTVGLAVTLTGHELQELIGRAIVAQASISR
jgi:hypothetical protein